MLTPTFTDVFHDPSGLTSSISLYLHWLDQLALTCLSKQSAFSHPYISTAQRHCRIRDGVPLTREEAATLLHVTRDQQGTELLEVALLQNFELLHTYPILEYKDLPKIIALEYPEHLAPYEALDRDISRAIQMSRCSLYTKCPKSRITRNDLFYTNNYIYDMQLQSGKVIYLDTQASEIAYKTDIPASYCYIFMCRLEKARVKQEHLMKLLT